MTLAAISGRDDLTYRLIVPADVMTIPVPRKLAEIALENWQLTHLKMAVATVVSELVTNACNEVPGTVIQTALGLEGGWLRLEVRDCSPVIPKVPTELRLDAIGGRGLWVASHLADKFGIDPHADGGKTIWAMWLQDPPGGRCFPSASQHPVSHPSGGKQVRRPVAPRASEEEAE
ncbi:ATP-binding protein [Actinomadura barringtoniae]|uniref:ATP-binding protein n=1 Tax=Actinomadura barringtoniae TaxID=1427535 RepID=A0A939P9G1_9ACTN|nr:ATP-binding protein [Actinomadura barringtoniae]MBO2448370.1 ATP-binding protein [Actinomadura barringtoniae]